MSKIEVELQEAMGTDRSISEMAWTSSLTKASKNLRTDEDVTRIVNMLADEGHATPFEGVIFRFWIRMPIQTDRQHMCHRVASHSGMSGRYRTMPSDYIDLPQDVSKLVMTVSRGQLSTYHFYVGEYTRLCNEANEVYKKLLKDFKDAEKHNVITNDEYKRLREFYRGVLPQNNMTERVTVMNLRSFANYMRLRSAPNAQPEIQQVANMMYEAVKASGVCPVALEALERNGWQL